MRYRDKFDVARGQKSASIVIDLEQCCINYETMKRLAFVQFADIHVCCDGGS